MTNLFFKRDLARAFERPARLAMLRNVLLNELRTNLSLYTGLGVSGTGGDSYFSEVMEEAEGKSVPWLKRRIKGSIKSLATLLAYGDFDSVPDPFGKKILVVRRIEESLEFMDSSWWRDE